MGDKNPKQKHRQDNQRHAAKAAKAAKAKTGAPVSSAPEKPTKS
jgi:hypothetical protein